MLPGGEGGIYLKLSFVALNSYLRLGGYDFSLRGYIFIKYIIV